MKKYIFTITTIVICLGLTGNGLVLAQNNENNQVDPLQDELIKALDEAEKKKSDEEKKKDAALPTNLPPKRPKTNTSKTPTPTRRTPSRPAPKKPIDYRNNRSSRTPPVQPDAPSGPTSHEIRGSEDNPNYMELLELNNVDIQVVLKLISEKSGFNIVADRNVKGRVSVYLKDIEVLDALKVIVDANGWAYAQEDGIIKVMADTDFEDRYGYKFGLQRLTNLVQLEYAKTADILAVLNQVKSSDGKIIANENTGLIILIDNPLKVNKMTDIIAKIDLPIETEVFELSYATAEDLTTKISEELTPNLGSIKSDERSNKVIVSDTPKKLAKIKDMIDEFDQKDREVLIEAKIVQIVLSDAYKFGVDWEAIVNDYHDLTISNNFDLLGDTAKQGKLSIGTLEEDRYTAVVQALNTVGDTEILSTPRIAAVNKKEAKILVGSTEPYVTTTTTTPASGPTTTAESINFIEVGVKLYVTPTIHKDDFITMNIKPEVSSVTSTIVTGNNNTIPVVETAEAETTVMVKDGITIVIGGLIKEEDIDTTNQVPFLGRIPIIGWAFKNRDAEKAKTEIVIFLTPRIITGDKDFQG